MDARLTTLDELRHRATLFGAPLLGALYLLGAWSMQSLPNLAWEPSFYVGAGIVVYCATALAWLLPRYSKAMVQLILLVSVASIETRLVCIFQGPTLASADSSVFLMLFAHIPFFYLFCFMALPSRQALAYSSGACLLFGSTTLLFLVPMLLESPLREGGRQLLIWTLASSPLFVFLLSSMQGFERALVTLKLEQRSLKARKAKYQHQARHDYLTGLLNRFSFDHKLDQLWLEAVEKQQPIAVAMIDIDHFKQLNDQYGHSAGDLALKQLAIILSSHVRSPDIVSRYGGEEFALLLSNTSLDKALQLANQLCQTVASTAIEVQNELVTRTISIGVSSIVPSAGQDYSGLINDADRALYLAKHNGRNRVEYIAPKVVPMPGANRPAAPKPIKHISGQL